MSTSRLSLEGKNALVTGARRGIGRAIAMTLAEAGADVAVCSRGGPGLERVADEIRSLGRRSLAVPADVATRPDVEKMVSTVVAELGGIDVLVNNAGIIHWKQPMLEMGDDVWDETLNTNLRGYWLCSQVVGRTMVSRGGGTIINVSSGSGVFPVPESGVYCISKAGVQMLTRVLALELGQFNIRVNAILPLWVKTEMNTHFRPNPEAEAAIAKGIPLGRLGEPEDIAKAALFLASDLSSYMSGSSVTVDGDISDTVYAGLR